MHKSYNSAVVEAGGYDQMCRIFGNVADVASEDEERTLKIMKWLEVQMSEMSVSTSCVPTVNMQCTDVGDGPNVQGSFKDSNDNVLDPICSKTKGAPRKNRKKSPLETASKKSKVHSKGQKVQNKEQGDAQNVQVMSQSSTFSQIPSFTLYSYSADVMVPPQAYGLHFMAPHPTNQQLLSMYARPPRPEEHDISRPSAS